MVTDEARAKSLALWDRMAAGWDKHNDYIWEATGAVGERLVELLDPQEGQTILDIAAGPGNTGFVASKLIGDDGKLISTDFSPEMVEVARSRAAKLGISNADFRVIDAEDMELPDDSVDGIICRWGFMLMLDPEAALRETRRVLRPGGKLACSVWGTPGDNPWITLMGMVLINRGMPPQGDPFGPGGMFSMSEHDRIHELVTKAGYAHVDIEDMPMAWHFTDFEDFWGFVMELAGAIAALLEGLEDDELAAVRKDAQTALEQYRTGDGYTLPGVTINVLAR